MNISRPKIEIVKDNVRVSADYKLLNQNEKRTLWYSINKKYINYLASDTSDCFLLGLLIMAMKNHEDIYLEGTISEKLYYNLNNYIQTIINIQCPILKKVNIYPKEYKPMIYNANGVATGFSGGIDSFSVLADHYYTKEVPTHYQINTLIFNNIADKEKITDKKNHYKKLYNFAANKNIDFLFIDSNVYSVFDLPMQKSHQIRNISAILLLQKNISKYYYASGFPYIYGKIEESDQSAKADFSLLHLFSTENLEVISTGGQYTRTKKTEQISNIPETYTFLDVCTDYRRTDSINCGKCFKCLRTLATFEILGKLEDYRNVFNLENYQKYRKLYFAKVLSENGQYFKEILELAKRKNFKFPIKSILLSNKILMFIYQLIRSVYLMIKKR